MSRIRRKLTDEQQENMLADRGIRRCSICRRYLLVARLGVTVSGRMRCRDAADCREARAVLDQQKEVVVRRTVSVAVKGPRKAQFERLEEWSQFVFAGPVAEVTVVFTQDQAQVLSRHLLDQQKGQYTLPEWLRKLALEKVGLKASEKVDSAQPQLFGRD